jgi:hypothetical protein
MLNTEHFLLLAGEPKAWDDEILLAKARGGDNELVRMQLSQNGRGRLSAQIVKGMYGYYVRAGSNLQVPSILANTRERGGTLDGSFDAALEWAVLWAQADPKNREAYVAKRDIPTTQGGAR